MSHPGQEPPLRVLLLEDSPDDVELISAELTWQNPGIEIVSIDSRAALDAALAESSWDVVVSDFHLPGFSALDALAELVRRGIEIPLIVVSSFIGEEATATLMKAGAADFVAKGNVRSLPSAISRALREARALRERAESEARFSALVTNLPSLIFQCEMGPDGPVFWHYLGERCLVILGVPRATLAADANGLLALIDVQDRDAFIAACRASMIDLDPLLWRGRVQAGPGAAYKFVEVRAGLRRLADGKVIADGTFSDITHSKLAEKEVLSSRERLRALTIHLDKVKEQERASIAREIHDELGGILTAAKIELATIARQLPADRPELSVRAVSAEALLDQAMDTSRRISRRLRPAVLDYGIVAAIDWQVRDFSKRMGIDCHFLSSVDEVRLSPEDATTVFRIVQEALTNVARHAHARSVRVEIASGDGTHLTVVVVDDGQGVTLQDLDAPESFGIRGMRERAQSLNGEMRLGPSPSGGTEVVLRFPLASGAAWPMQAAIPFEEA